MLKRPGRRGGKAASNGGQVPYGSIDEPTGPVSDSEFNRVRGWAFLDSEPVSSVQVYADGRPLGNARIGLARRDLASISTATHSPVCGFEAWLRPEHLSTNAEQVTLEVELLGTRGSRFRLAPVTRRINHSNLEAQPSVDDASEHVLRVQERIRRIPRVKRRTSGVRLLVISHRLDRSGAPLYLLTLLPRLLAEGIECTVISPEDGPLRRDFERAGIPVHVSYMNLSDAVTYESKLWELAAWAAPEGFDIVHVNAIDSFLGADLAMRLGIPAIWAIHESFTPHHWFAANDWSPHPHVRQCLLRGFRTAAAVLVSGDETRAGLLPYTSRQRLVTLPYGLDLERIDRFRAGVDRFALRQGHRLSAGDTVVLSVATIEPRKGQTVMAQAFAALADLPGEPMLMLVGETGSDWTAGYVEGLRDFIRRMDLDSRIRIAPVTPHYYEWLAIADIFLLASDIESLPLSVLEAMAFELPVVATRVSGIPGVVDDGVTGIVCEPSDVSELTRALRRALSLTPAERRHAGRQGAEMIRARHDIRRYTTQYSLLVHALVADPGTSPADALAREHERQAESDPSYPTTDNVLDGARETTASAPI